MRTLKRFPLLPLGVLVAVALLTLAPAAAAKSKKVACKSGQATVTVGKRTSCVPLAKAFPQPQDVDIRLVYLQQAVKRAPAKTATQKRAQRQLLKALPKVLARLDRNAAAGAGASRAADPVAFASACSPDGPIENIGSHQGVGIAAVGNNGGQMTLSSGGLTFRTRFAKCGFSGFAVPECPAANGDVVATGRSSFQVTEEVLDGERVVSRRNTTVESKSKARGKVAADAKLDYVVFSSTEETFIVASGGLVHRGTTEYEARVNMRNGSYDPAGARVRAAGDARPADGAQSFASTVEQGISDFRVGENGGSFLRDDGWATFNRKRGSYCAKATFSPEVNTLKLRKGKKDEVGIYAKARDGGKASEARWTLLDQENAEFSPTSSQQAEPRVSYTVTKAPVPGFVKVKAKFTSTAGVGEDTWTQPTEKGTINRIAGTFSYRREALGSVYHWAGNVTFERFSPAILGGASGIFKFKQGQLTVTASGTGAEFFSAPLCSQRGGTQMAFSEGTELAVLGSGDEQTEPYQYSFSLSSHNNPPATITVELFDCAEPAKAQEGVQPPVPLFFDMFSRGFQESPDGLTYEGSRTEAFPGLSITETWSFKGSE